MITVAFVLLPVLIFFGVALRISVRAALLRVFVPTLVLIPAYIEFSLGGLLIESLTGMIVFLAGYGVFYLRRGARLKMVDLAVLSMLGIAFYADFHLRTFKVSLYSLLFEALLLVFPYVIGRTVLEQLRLRADFSKAFVCSLAVVGMVSLWEYRMTSSPFDTLATIVLQHPSAWGLMGHLFRVGPRTQGPYGSAILCAMVFSVGIFLQLWLHAMGYWRTSARRNSRWTYVVWFALLVGLATTQSRGPFIGLVLGLFLASVGLFKKPARALAIALPILLVVGAGLYVAIDSYTNVEYKSIAKTGGTLDQQNAAYRRELIKTYLPLVEKGGPWGWGTPLPIGASWGFSTNQVSIDNEYLRTAVGQGYVGFCMFVLIVVLTTSRMLLLVLRTRDRSERLFFSAIFGIIACYAFTITTVYLGEPVLEIFFLFCGWAQTLKATQAVPVAVPVARTRPMHVYV